MKVKAILISIISLVLVATIAFCVVSTGILNPIGKQIKLGYKYLEEGNYEEAILAFNKAIEIDPNEMSSYIGIINAYEQIEDSEKTYLFATKMFRALVESDNEIDLNSKYGKYAVELHLKTFDEIFEDWYSQALTDTDRKKLRESVAEFLLNIDNEKYSEIIDRAVRKYKEYILNDLLENGAGTTYSAGNTKYTFKRPQWWTDVYSTDGMMDELYVFHNASKNEGYGGVLFAITEDEPLAGYESELIENDLGVVYYWNLPTEQQTGGECEDEYNRMKDEVEIIRQTFMIEDDSPMGRYTNGDYVTLTGKLIYFDNQGYYSLETDKKVNITHHDANGMGFGTTSETRFRVVSYTDLSDYKGKQVKVSGNLNGAQRGSALNIYDYTIYDAIVELNE